VKLQGYLRKYTAKPTHRRRRIIDSKYWVRDSEWEIKGTAIPLIALITLSPSAYSAFITI
jgi:hypothetical protein